MALPPPPLLELSFFAACLSMLSLLLQRILPMIYQEFINFIVRVLKKYNILDIPGRLLFLVDIRGSRNIYKKYLV